MERVIVYVDGFNLYFGMTSKYKNVKWLNIQRLAQKLLRNNQQLEAVKYFTSRVSGDPLKEHRQRIYLDAITTTGVNIFYGHYKSRPSKCNRCGSIRSINEEKMTDVNIATHLIIDAYQNKYDTALLISGDSDLIPPIEEVHKNFRHKRIVVGFPPKRKNLSVSKVAKGSFIIGRKKLKDSQFPQRIKKADGFILEKPTEW